VNDIATLVNPLLQGGMDFPTERKSRGVENLGLPAGTKITSADDHWCIVDDIFHERMPSHLKDMAPRIFKDQTWRIGVIGDDGTPKLPFPMTDVLKKVLTMSGGMPGSGDIDKRLKDMDQEGFDQTIMYPQMLLGLIRHPHLELREQIFRIYNEYIAERAKQAPDRLFPVGVFGNWWDPAAAERSMQQIVDLGLKTFMMPLEPGVDVDGKPIAWGEPMSDHLFSVISESGVPLSLHIGESPKTEGRGGWGINVLTTIQPFIDPFARFVFSGLFDRNPKLQVVFAEGGFGWVPVMLQDAEMIMDNYPPLHNPKPKHRPTDYWREHCYATFMNDPIGFENIHHVGTDRIMWSCDYPHAEGTFGYSWQSMKAVVDAVGPEAAVEVLGGNARRVYKLP